MQQATKGNRLTVLDLFCGAGGFSEGFRSLGFQVVAGIDHWRPAVETFNHNHGLKGDPQDILSFESNVQLIEELPDTEVIIGSPPCVSFSYSNKLGNADKTEGKRLIKIFLSIVAVKKHKQGSRLVAWYMENVANAMDHLPDFYSFEDLGLAAWASGNRLDPGAVAIRIKDNAAILDAADFGVAQARKRLFVGEINSRNPRRKWVSSMPAPAKTSKKHKSARSVRSRLPAPNCKLSNRKIQDPLYRSIRIPLEHVTDHFYETGAFEIHWRDSRLLKVSHPYMGKMAFPENEDRPSRTIVASPFPRSREALLYKSEWGRIGNGEYRGPTVREAATLMSFPITYQFVGSEGAKWKLVGNAVCPLVARALGVQLLKAIGQKIYRLHRKEVSGSIADIQNLNTFKPKSYSNPPKRKKMARFRSHPFKAGSMTVALTNYNVTKAGSEADGYWRCFVTYGIGSGFKIQTVKPEKIKKIRLALETSSEHGKEFVERVMNGFSERIPSASVLQEYYEENIQEKGRLYGPTRLLEEIEKMVFQYVERHSKITAKRGLFLKKSVPISQLYALFAVSHIVSVSQLRRGRSVG